MIQDDNTNSVVEDGLQEAYHEFCRTGATTLLCDVKHGGFTSDERYRFMNTIRKSLLRAINRYSGPYHPIVLEIVRKDGKWGCYIAKGV